MKLDSLFKPNSLAVVGASHEPEKLGYMVLKNIKKYGFKGDIFPVNPHVAKIQGLKCYQTVSAIKYRVELAIIVVPAPAVAAVLEDCGKAKVETVIIISAGFKEVGTEGAAREDEIKKIAKKYNIRVLGPNCLGIINTYSNLNASFAESMPEKWDIAMFSQSGAMCTAILDWANANGIGFSKFMSLGNKADISEADILEVLSEDEKTKVVLGYIEGIEDGDRFLKAAKKITKTKPFIVIKSGSSDEGARAISSHTGSLAGFDQATDAAFKHAGIIRARTIEDLFDAGKIFSLAPMPKGNKVAIITNAGGPGIMTTDAVDNSAFLEMASLSEETRTYLKKNLPDTANVKNPIDVIGDARADRYEKAIIKALADKNVDMVLVLLTPQIMTEVEKTASLIVRLKKKTTKPIAVSFIGGKKVASGIDILEKGKVPTFAYPERAVKSMEFMIEYKNYLGAKGKAQKRPVFDKETAKEILKMTKEGMTEIEVSGILGSYGIPVSKALLAKDGYSAVRSAMVLGYPVVMKIASPDILHKTDIGAVSLNLRNKDEVLAAYKEIMKNAKEKAPKARIKGVSVFPMITEGQEVIIGGKRDDVFGPIIMFGLGGIYVEALKDVVFRICPVSKDEAKSMIAGIKTAGLLTGYRGQGVCDTDAIAEVIVRISALMTDFPEIKEIDVNPLRVYEKGEGAKVLDAKIVL